MESGDDMSVSEKMTGLMNAVRSMSGTTSELSVDDATAIAGSAGQWGVRVPNLIEESTAEYKSFSGKNSYQYASGVVKAGTKYTTSIDVKNASIDVKIIVVLYDNSWNWDNTIKSRVQKNGHLQLTFTPDRDGFAQFSIFATDEKSSFSCDYAKAMWNEGDYAPYTSSTKPYTVDSLAERLTALENKLGGVTKPVLSAIRRLTAPLNGGVTLVA